MKSVVVAAAISGCSLVVDLDALKTAAGDASVMPDSGDASSDVLVEVGSYFSEVSSDSPNSWWRLGETSTLQLAKDENSFAAGQYRDAGVTLGVTGALKNDGNTAVQLDGVAGAVIMAGSDYVLDGLPSFTIEIWASPTTAQNTPQRLVSHRTSSSADGWVLFLDASMVPTFQELTSGTPLATVHAPNPLPLGTFTHVVVTGDGSTLTMYIDGQLAGQATQASVPTTVAPGLVLGASSGVAQEFFAGKLDEAAIYIKCLSPQRVLAHYLAATH